MTSREPAFTPDEFTLALADPASRRVFGAVALGSSTPSAILAATGLDAPVAAKAIGRLTRAGLLVAGGNGRLAVDETAVARAAESAGRRREEEAAAEQPDARLRGFVRGRVLLRLPEETAPESREAVLRHVVAAAFAPSDEGYDERAVTERLKPWCQAGATDAVSLRRALVDLGVLHREAGRYRLITDR
ncbi:DUF2087 domain-containing protein [Streptomyces sp. NPDC002225]|uniref:DUF2087 domain-containing protein n=1 Tax=Streptomyces sp. NPDC002225 TaxID=3154413 RepID=UPI00332D9B54